MRAFMTRDAVCSMALITLLIGSVCTGCVCAIDPSQMSKVETNVIYLATKVDDLYRTNKIPMRADDETIFDLATEKDRNIRSALTKYAARFKIESRHAVVLICTKDKRQALVEMSACSMGPDRKPWKSNPPEPCEFALDKTYLENACKISK